MSHNAAVLEKPIPHPDYSLTGVNATLAIEKGLAEADWYQCAVPRETMRELLVRRDGPAIRDTILWFALIIGSGYATWPLWGTWWAILPYASMPCSTPRLPIHAGTRAATAPHSRRTG